MAKKVYELANEIGVGALDLVEKLKSMGFNVRNHMAVLTDEELAKAQSAYGPSQKAAPPTRKAVVRKVIKREAVEETPVKETSTPEVAATAATETPGEAEESKPKVVTVKRKSKAQKEQEEKIALEAKET